MSKYTAGPWKTGREDMQSFDGATGEAFTNIYHSTKSDGRHHVTKEPLPLVIGRAEGDNNKANARLIAASPSMEIVLRMLSLGIARIERSETCALVEFCFDGLRYAVSDGDWTRLISAIGWNNCESAIAKAEGVTKCCHRE